MNLNDLYEMKDPRDAYQRDYDSSVNMGKQSRADVTGEEEPSGIFTVMIDGRAWKTGSSNEMFGIAERVANKYPDKKIAVKWPTGQLNTIKPQGMEEGQKWPDISNSIADRNVVVPNLDAYRRGETGGSKAGRPGGMTVATRVNPTITSTKVQRKDDRPIPSFLQKGVAEGEVDSNGYSVDHADSGEYDYEGDQARDQMNTIVRAAQRLNGMLDDDENMPEWVQMKVTLAADYLDTAADYIESNQEPELAEGDVTRTPTGLVHHATDKYGAGEEPFNPRNPGKYVRDLDHVNKQQVKDLDASMGITWKNRGTNGVEVDEGDKKPEAPEADYGDDYQDMVKRLKQLAGAGPLKTVYDPDKRVYRNVPTATQPKR